MISHQFPRAALSLFTFFTLLTPCAAGCGSGGDDDDDDCAPQQYKQCGAGGDVHWFDSCDVEGAVAVACDSCETCSNQSATTASCGATTAEGYQQCGADGDVHWFDSCGAEGAVVDTCEDCEACRNDSEEEASCGAAIEESYQQCGADGDVHWFNSCDVEGALVETCAACETCTNDTAITAWCPATTVEAYQQCSLDGNVHWFDSCDGEGALVDTCEDCEVCNDDSATSASCSVASAQAYQQCSVDGNVHWFDSCGVQGALVDTCEACEVCNNHTPMSASCDAVTVHLYQQCGADGNVHWYDSCDAEGALVHACAGCATCTDTSSTTATCIGPNNYMFVTSTTYTPGALGGLAGADAECQARADAAGLSGTYVAWLSTSTIDARERLAGARGWLRTDGVPFADTVNGLVLGAVLYPPNRDESGNEVPQSALVLTGSDEDGTASYSYSQCGDWATLLNEFTVGGYAHSGGTYWTFAGARFCNDGDWYLYCFGVDYCAELDFTPAAGRYAFVSAEPFPVGTDIGDADAQCQSEATTAGLPGTYKALLATESASAVSRFNLAGTPWVRTDGVPLVAQAADLATGTLVSALSVNADGVTYEVDEVAWTGATSPDAVGTAETTCESWTNSTDSQEGSEGHCKSMSLFFSANRSRTCNSTFLHLYCLQE